MAKESNQQPPEDNSRPAAAADQTGPGSITIDLQGKRVTILPKKQETDPEAIAAAEKQMQEAQKRLADAFNNSPAAQIMEQQRRMNDILRNPAIESVMRQQEMIHRLTAGVQPIVEINRAIVEAMRSPAIEAIQNMVSAMQEGLATAAGTFGMMQNYFNSDSWATARQTLEQIATAAPAILELAKEIEELTPYLEAELKKPEYEGMTLDDLLEGAETDDSEPAADSLLMKALTAARAARDAAKQEPERITIKRAEIVEYPLDKPNAFIWNLLGKNTSGQISFEMATDKDKRKGISLPALYAINFDALSDVKITKRLLPFDKLAYIAVGALYNAGNKVVTLSQIYYAMGYTGKKPGDSDRDKIFKSITKMRKADIFFSNEAEAQRYKYPLYKYTGYLLPCDICEAIVNGNRTEVAIRLFAEPPLITFAKQRQQITTLDIKLLQAPVSKTDENLQIQDYLLERISKAKNGKARSCRILLKTLYDHAGIPDKPKTNTEKQQKKRAPEKIKRYLTHYQGQGFITRFTMEKDGMTVHW